MSRYAALLLLLLVGNAIAYSGKELLEDCKAAEAAYNEKQAVAPYASPQAARCLAYVTGFAEGYGIADHLAGQVGVQIDAFCLPRSHDRNFRLLRAVLTHLESQPLNARAGAPTLVGAALAKAFPCGQ